MRLLLLLHQLIKRECARAPTNFNPSLKWPANSTWEERIPLDCVRKVCAMGNSLSVVPKRHHRGGVFGRMSVFSSFFPAAIKHKEQVFVANANG